MIYLGILVQISALPTSEVRFFHWRNEFWRRLSGHEKEYLISSYGRVIRIRRNGNRKMLSIRKTKEGYCKVVIRTYSPGVKCSQRTEHTLSRLVALTFIGKGEDNVNPESKAYINHKDLDPRNNHYTNLEWVNLRENKTHSVRTTKTRTFTSKFTGVSKSKNVFTADIGVNGKKILLGRFNSELDAARAYDKALVEYNLVNRYQTPLKN